MREACGLFGVYFPGGRVAELLRRGLFFLQHRGQEAAGFAVSDGKRLVLFKGPGLVDEVFSRGEGKLRGVPGPLGIAHTRYSTCGESTPENAQPFAIFREGRWIALAHNGTVANAVELGNTLRTCPKTDSELLLRLYAAGGRPPGEGLARIAERAAGAYCLLILDGDRLIAARDPWGFRPLVVGKKGEAWAVASEPPALELLGFAPVAEVAPGEAWAFPGPERWRFARERGGACVFELIYFARPDSRVFGREVYAFRLETGRRLARGEREDIDVVVPIPDSGIPAAIGYARALGVPLELGLIRSHYVGRSFIEPTPMGREEKVRRKLFPVRAVLRGKRVALVDDSLVRGTTSRAIVGLVREFGAEEVHLRLASPPIVAPCHFGIDLPTEEELIAARMDLGDIREFVGADSVAYLPLKELKGCLGEGAGGFCFGCFTGEYPEGSTG